MPSFGRHHTLILSLAIGLPLLGIFVLDLQTPLGVGEWVFYLVPAALGLLARRPWLPLAVAAVATALIIAGYYGSPPGLDPAAAALNRSIGTLCLWLIAGIGAFYIRARLKLERAMWLQSGEAEISQQAIGEQTPEVLGNAVLRALVRLAEAEVGVLYLLDGGQLKRIAAWGLPDADRLPRGLSPAAAGLAGQAISERRILLQSGLPSDHLRIGSTLGQSVPAHVIAAPLLAEGLITGVIELGFLRKQRDFEREIDLTRVASDNIGMALRAAVQRTRLQDLLEETQRQGEELQAQQEELRVSNEELEQQAQALQESQARLEAQQAELEQSNVQLEDQAQRLESQKQMLLASQRTLAANAESLERANQYKSEFLANMSHELRTPLNSSLILAKLLADNKQGNLTPEQTRYAQTIHASNSDLLNLINDILDLSKIEAGRVDMQWQDIPLDKIRQSLERTFQPVAAQKKLSFQIEATAGLPTTLFSDEQRLLQVLKNLLSNALKFTEKGHVKLRIASAPGEQLRFEVSDTGIGIAPDNQQVIFEAFRQADGSTSRKYGGSGLGLSISRELAHLLGGDISVASEAGQGSTFTLQVPLRGNQASPSHTPPPLVHAPTPRPSSPAAMEPLKDDRAQRTRGGRLILVVEDDLAFSEILYDLIHELDFDCVRASSAAEGLRLARELRPSAILLDVGLPDDSGLMVLETLKRDARTRHIPVHMVSLHDYTNTALQLGAIGYTLKPLAREELVGMITRLETRLKQQIRRVLVVEDDATLRESIILLLQAAYTEIVSAGSVAEALALLAQTSFDCVVMDLALPDGSGHELLQKMANSGNYAFPPVIVYTGRMLDAEEEQKLRRYSNSIIIKGAKSPERLLDEVTLFLHSVESDLPPDQQRMLRDVRHRDAAFEGRTILVAEDDVRNIFALSQIIEPLGAKLEIARNGREALEKLNQRDIDLVLMDIMMPEMDGLEAMRAIRANPALGKLPIIALTAKAMPEDRRACLEAGANDYIAKPIDIDRLLSLCRVWMPQ